VLVEMLWKGEVKIVKAGIIAGEGKLPVLIGTEMEKAEIQPVFFYTTGTKLPKEIEGQRVFYFELGDLNKLTDKMLEEEIEELVLVGKFTKLGFFTTQLDSAWQKILAKSPNFQNEPVLKALIEHFQEKGIEVLSQAKYLKNHIARKGPIAGEITSELFTEVEFGYEIAKVLADLDISQTVVVKKRAVIALEGIDGTNATILRAGELAKDAVALKVSSSNQDWRLDVPTIGLDTIKAAIKSNISVIGLEAQKVFLIDKEECIKLANENGLIIYGYSKE